MATLYIMCGLAFSGKSTLARKIADHTGGQRIAFDELWIEEQKIHSIKQGGEGWEFIRKVAKDKIAKALGNGESVVYDDTNPRFEHREEMRNIAKNLGYGTVVVYVNTPIEIIRQREQANRISPNRHEVEPTNFQETVDQMETPGPGENVLEFTPNTNLDEFLKTI